MDSSYLNGLTVLAWTIACAWMAIVFVFGAACRKLTSLRPTTDSSNLSELPKLSVIVAARNESGDIETCIRSLFRQDYPDLEVIAVNDRSSDDTGKILDRLALEFSNRLKVIHISALPTGWFGKPHALSVGMRSAAGSVVCFTDADCEFLAPAALRTTVDEMNRGDIDLISITAKYTMNSLRESIVVPCCAECLVTWLRPERVSDPDWPDAFANGAFMMARRAQFESVGGWGAVRMKISEDLEMARVAKRQGLRLSVADGEGFYKTGSYATWRESWNGWSRIMVGVLTPAQLANTLVRMMFLFALPLGAVIWGMSHALHTGSFAWMTHGAGLAFTIAFSLRSVLDLMVFRLAAAPTIMAPFAPLGRIFVMCSLTRALLSHAGLVKTHWRGATFVAGRMIIPKAPPE